MDELRGYAGNSQCFPALYIGIMPEKLCSIKNPEPKNKNFFMFHIHPKLFSLQALRNAVSSRKFNQEAEIWVEDYT